MAGFYLAFYTAAFLLVAPLSFLAKRGKFGANILRMHACIAFIKIADIKERESDAQRRPQPAHTTTTAKTCAPSDGPLSHQPQLPEPPAEPGRKPGATNERDAHDRAINELTRSHHIYRSACNPARSERKNIEIARYHNKTIYFSSVDFSSSLRTPYIS